MKLPASMYPAEEMQSKPNFRQVGTKATGAMMRGAAALRQPPPEPNMVRSCVALCGFTVRRMLMNVLSHEQKVSSIPSKYETVLHRDPNERNGFGQRTQRFGDCEVRLELVEQFKLGGSSEASFVRIMLLCRTSYLDLANTTSRQVLCVQQ